MRLMHGVSPERVDRCPLMHRMHGVSPERVDR
jgi:hypothetical protein